VRTAATIHLEEEGTRGTRGHRGGRGGGPLLGGARDFLARQPGYVSTRLHHALRPDARFQLINVAERTSAEAFQAATARMQRELTAVPPSGLRFTPALYRVIRE
jgi:hypothetical protein